ncbi:MAG: ornithine cyclodeaminase family protein [Actinobacteria bacterium]|nr:ornithine cyclodeaminase family protein [Actinomycetota bacterium]
MNSNSGSILILTQADVQSLLDITEMLEALESAFIDFSAGRASVPPRSAARSESGLLGAMPGYLPSVALEAKLVTVFPNNHDRGIPSHQGLIVLFDEDDGSPLAVMDAMHITAMRTAGGAAVSVKALASDDVSILAILGSGTQGHSHLATVPITRDFAEIRIASRNLEHAATLAEKDNRAIVANSFEEAVRGADVICCCTDAREPIIRYEWMKPGAHVTAVGGSFGPELDTETIERCRIFVEWRGAAENPPPAGAHELQGVAPERLTEMGEVLSGSRPGRESSEEITVYKSTGHAIEDAAAARIVYDRALKDGIGQKVAI